MPQLSKPQAYTLAAFSLGVALARSCTLRRVAQALAGLGKPDTVERRLQRFLSNDRLVPGRECRTLARWVLGSLRPQGPIVLLVDETTLQERMKVMAGSLAYQGRALPLAWWCYPQEEWPMSQVELIMTLLRAVAREIPPGIPVLVQADRGIGSSPALLRQIQALGWYFLVRVQGGVRLLLEDGGEVAFKDQLSEPGQRWSSRVYAFKKAGWMACWAVGQWENGQAEPWFLLTNWREGKGGWYSMRMWEELAFRDFKSFGWQWQKSRVWNPAHAHRLWLVLALAYAWVVTLGSMALASPSWKRELTRGKQPRYSVFQLGLTVLHRWMSLNRHPFRGLSLQLCPITRLKNVVI